MPEKAMTTDQQISKLNAVMSMAKEAAASDELARRAGAVTLYAGLVDFFIIQAARLMEQVILKARLAEGEEPRFKPRSDSYFYDERVNTRHIVSYIKRKILPFRAGRPDSAEVAERANVLAQDLVKKTNDFLNYRNAIIHHVGSPKVELQELATLCEKATRAYEVFLPAHKALFETLQPYRFGQEELQYFYGNHAG